MDIVWRILATLALVALNAYFVAAEFAAVSARLARLETDAQTRFSSRLALRIKRQLDLYLSTCQLGITIASLGLGAVTEPAIASLIEPLLHAVGVQPPGPATHSAIAIVIALSISTALHVVVGEQAPKNWAILYADRILPLLAAPLVVFTYLFYPVIWLLNAASNGLLRATGVELHSSSHGQLPHSEAELRTILSQAVTAGTLPQTNQRLLQSAFSLAELKVRQIMTPRTKIDFLTIDQPVDQLLRIVQKSAYTRLPLCDKDIDHVLGMIHMKDLFNHLKLIPGRLRFADLHTPDGQAIAIADGAPGSEVHVIGSGHIDLNAIRRDVLFVPELSPAEDLLRQFQSSHNHLAIVVDEYGSTVGLVTLEDVLEEIVGEIEDEFDVRQAGEFTPDGDGWRVSGAFPLHELKQRLNLAELDLNGVDTLGGYITRELGRWPRTGDQLQVGAYQAQVLTVNKRRATQVRLARHKSN